MSGIRAIILPVLAGMPESHLRNELLPAFSGHADCYATIEQGFQRLTQGQHGAEVLRRFFQSWSQTNNSAMTVAGISNRLSQIVYLGKPLSKMEALLRALTSLHRIIDEDLAVTHRTLHSELFYTMATGIVGDDEWLRRHYLLREATDFKAWKDAQSLRGSDLMIALLTTLVHEIYTHGEVEYILPLFKRWLQQDLGHSARDAAHTLAWISVHCGPTEKNHFFHARDSILHYAEAMAVDLRDYRLGDIVSTYLQKKANVLRALFPEEVGMNRSEALPHAAAV